MGEMVTEAMEATMGEMVTEAMEATMGEMVTEAMEATMGEMVTEAMEATMGEMVTEAMEEDDSGTTGQPIGFLNIKKNVLGDNRPASDFRLNIAGNNPSKTAISGSPDGVDVIVGEGYYKVTEQPINGYTTTYSEGCEGDINMNPQREFCVVTNAATAKGSLKVSVHAIEEGCPFLYCPSPSPNDFQITVTGSGGQLYSFMGSSTKLIDPGAYSVRQQAPSGFWNVDFSEGCEDRISAGQLKTCIITNRGYADP